MMRLIIYSAFLFPALMGGYFLRRAGCSWGRTIFGGVMFFVLAVGVLMGVFAFCRRYGWDFDAVFPFLPVIEIAVFGGLLWGSRNRIDEVEKL